ncbi:YiiD C-terminal domain-containing protein [Sphingobacterium bovistauri]|uniref:YiiD C-terminal domain-containing protein n=1 Tax=Sphingobacterium bovistauri TaxID=2781959 RepID=A0ABS7Z863_9SPHI|nr:YiiD C-terminal domain-containing protein [Sphingobacterium bovistauri]MCA5006335.1 YiiD C-terminal domain-containing protein [Sphingobacterium bovistauri]
MKLSPSSLKWVLRTYPPFFFQRIWVKEIYANFRGAEVKIYKSFLNINSNKTVFGGTIFSALDPMHSILLDQVFKQKGLKKTVAWLKSAKIDYLKPGTTDLTYRININEDELNEAFQTIKENGKVIKTFTTEVFDMKGVKCAVCQNEIYIRDLTFDFSKLKHLIREKNKTA